MKTTKKFNTVRNTLLASFLLAALSLPGLGEQDPRTVPDSTLPLEIEAWRNEWRRARAQASRPGGTVEDYNYAERCLARLRALLAEQQRRARARNESAEAIDRAKKAALKLRTRPGKGFVTAGVKKLVEQIATKYLGKPADVALGIFAKLLDGLKGVEEREYLESLEMYRQFRDKYPDADPAEFVRGVLQSGDVTAMNSLARTLGARVLSGSDLTGQDLIDAEALIVASVLEDSYQRMYRNPDFVNGWRTSETDFDVTNDPKAPR
ncbi:MAG: hypothetical protein HY720_04880 [Planctomycetes bacterium]|nr:hypothetical protein [Planctomycetota bacterium]